MNTQNKTIKNILRGIATIFAVLLLIGNIAAQDKTAAGVYNDGLAMLKEKNFEAGLPLMEEALSLAEAEENDQVIKLAKKNGSVAAYNVGNTQRKAKAYDEALVAFEKGIGLDPDYASNYFGKAQVLEAQENDLEALVAHLIAAEKYIASGKKARGNKIISKAQNDVGRAYVGKDYDLAITLGSAFLENQTSAEVHYYLAQSYAEKSDNENALAHATKAVEISMADEEGETKDKYHFAKGSALENLGKNTDAVEAFKLISGEKYKEQAEYKIQKLGSN
jgi:tetratricopeptide (TPR) repeat protein